MKDLKKENIENLSYKDIANLILEKEKNGMNTLDLFTKIVNLLELPSSTIEEKIAEFYTNLAIDKRFILLDGIWDLRKRHTSDKIIVDETEEDEDTEIEENRDEMDTIEDEYDDEYTDDASIDSDYDDSDDDDLSDLVVIDEEDLSE